MGMMKQAAQLQSKMQALQAELDTITVDGTAGGGVVTVTLTAKGDLKAVKIDDSMMKPGEAEIVEDLLIAAHADARKHAEAVLQEKMQAVTGSTARRWIGQLIASPEYRALDRDAQADAISDLMTKARKAAKANVLSGEPILDDRPVPKGRSAKPSELPEGFILDPPPAGFVLDR